MAFPQHNSLKNSFLLAIFIWSLFSAINDKVIKRRNNLPAYAVFPIPSTLSISALLSLWPALCVLELHSLHLW